ncbi:hypothetical protein Sjap_020034 [Stephania japonica]|uniref:BHLH domain-containing protein n=1 Tax=Stephania japonica TaxID=461633 RepID=A0AAP0I040_9MAGN
MGTELDAFPFPQQELKANRTALEMISSWLDDSDDHPSYASDYHHHHHHHDQFQYRYDQNNHGHGHHPPFHYLDSSPSDQFDLDPLSLLPATTTTNTLDSLFPHNIYSAEPLPLHSTTHQSPPHHEDECDTYLVDNLYTPSESQGSQISTDAHDQQFYEKLMPEQMMSLDDVNDSNKNNASAEDNEDEDSIDEDDPPSRPRGAHCKNLVSERNRRKRLSQQLLALRALVPNITKMDKRSVLVDALNYLRSIHEETARLQKEVKQQQNQQQHHQKQPRLISDIKESCQDNPAGTLRVVPRTAAPPPSALKPKPQITEIDTERIEDRRFVVKIACKGSGGVGGDVLRVIESMGWEITNATVLQISSQEILATIFIKVRKPGKMTEEKLKDCITSMALRSGLTLQNP